MTLHATQNTEIILWFIFQLLDVISGGHTFQVEQMGPFEKPWQYIWRRMRCTLHSSLAPQQRSRSRRNTDLKQSPEEGRNKLWIPGFIMVQCGTLARSLIQKEKQQPLDVVQLSWDEHCPGSNEIAYACRECAFPARIWWEKASQFGQAWTEDQGAFVNPAAGLSLLPYSMWSVASSNPV